MVWSDIVDKFNHFSNCHIGKIYHLKGLNMNEALKEEAIKVAAKCWVHNPHATVIITELLTALEESEKAITQDDIVAIRERLGEEKG